MDLTIEKIPKKDLERMKMMFFMGYSVSEIAEICDRDIDTIRFYVFGVDETGADPLCWHVQKKEVDKTGLLPYIKSKVDALEKATSTAYNLLTKGLKGLDEKEGYEFTVQEVKQITDIVSALDKITRLETGKATDISEVVSVTLSEARDILRKDPFLVAEYSIVENKEEELEVPDMNSPWGNP